MSRVILFSAAILFSLGLLLAQKPQGLSDKPQYTPDNKLIAPANYREWVFLSAGLGMNYSAKPGEHDMFTNVFVPQWAYKEFMNTGKWPDKTTFVVEERGAQSRGSINKHGNFQTDLKGTAVEVKDSSRPDLWTYYSFNDANPAEANPKTACWSCHDEHAAVEHTFVQFYPTLKPVAQKFGTYKASAEVVQ